MPGVLGTVDIVQGYHSAAAPALFDGARLLVLRDHVVDSHANRRVGPGRAAARRHVALAIDGMRVQSVPALRDARAPRRAIAHLRGAVDACRMTGRTDLGEGLLAA